MVNYDGLIGLLSKTNEPFGLLTVQATSTTGRLMKIFPDRFKALFATEGGFFDAAAQMEETLSTWHPYWNRPIHALTGDRHRPTPEMLEGLGRIVIDLCDIGVRSYSFLATIKGTLEACAEAGIAVTVLDRQIPMGGVLDGPMREPEFFSDVAPLNVPFCHGMTPAECALWIRNAEDLDIDLTVARLNGWSHKMRDPWPNFIPPSADIPTWDSAAFYPMTVFTEACPEVDCGIGSPLAYRVIGAPWINQTDLIKALAPGLASCGVAMRPYRYVPQTGMNRWRRMDGILFSVTEPTAFYPVTAGVLLYTALLQRYGDKVLAGGTQDKLDRLIGSTALSDTIEGGDLGDLFQGWIDAQDQWLATRVDLYRE